MIQYWEKKERIETGVGEDVDWESHSKAIKNFIPWRMWLTKHCSGWVGSGKMMLKWNYRDNAKCPRCDKCQHVGNINSFIKATEPLKEWLKETTSPRIKSLVMTHMKAYQRDIPVNGFRTSNEETKQLSQAQDALGRRSFGAGFLAHGWRDLQMKYYGGTEGKEKSTRWVTKLIQKIWEVSWAMWESRNHLIHHDTE